MTAEEKLFRAHIKRMLQLIQSQYHAAIEEIALAIPTVNYKGGIFQVKNYPQLQKAIEKALGTLNTRLYAVVVNGIDTAWQMSTAKNNELTRKRIGGLKIPNAKTADLLYNPNRAALTAFKARKRAGMDLSQRVWKRTKYYKYELEKGLAVGISEGRPAAVIAKDLKRYLNEPDKLFRRVRRSTGGFKISKAAQDYKPGKGVYRSSFKNALRLTATETNAAYRTADHVRWKQLPFVKAIDVRLSDAHPRADICDALKGQYPKDFKFVGWHTRCLCHAVAVLMNDEEYSRHEDWILGITDKKPAVAYYDGMPVSAKKWIRDNAEVIKKAKPYFLRDNEAFLKPLLQ